MHHTNAKVILHHKAIEGLRKGQNSFVGGCSGKIVLLFCKLMGFFGKGKHRFPPIEKRYEGRYIAVDEHNKSDIESKLHGKIIETPGHGNPFPVTDKFLSKAANKKLYPLRYC